MKKIALLIPLMMGTALLSAQEAVHSVSPATYFKIQNNPSDPKQKLMEATSEAKMAAMQSSSKVGQSEVMIINPEMRAKDIQESFDYLKKMTPASKLAVKLVNGTLISEILDMQLMKGGTMIIFRTNSIQGQKFQVVKIEDIDTITNG